MEKRNYTLLLALIIVSIITVSTAFAATITIQPSEGAISQGATTEFRLLLDSAPDGIAGYNLNVGLSNPAVAEITGVTYPSWESLNNTTYLSNGQVRMSGVDIAKTIQPGATDILLGTLTIRGTSQGVTGFSINSIRIDADGGGAVVPVVTNAQLSVQGGATITTTPTKSGGSYSGGGGGSGGSYSGYSSAVSGATTTMAPTATQTIQNPVITPEGTQNVVTNIVTKDTPVQTSTTRVVTSPVSTESIPEGNNSSFPWLMLVEIIIVIGLIAGVVILYYARNGL